MRKYEMLYILSTELAEEVRDGIVSKFENVVKEVSIIVCFQSLILGMAGNVGTQSLAVTIRSLMNESFDKEEKLKLIFKEIKIGFSNFPIVLTSN